MKKFSLTIFASILFVFAFALYACGNDKDGTYYPPNEEMKLNLENSGYAVTVYQDLSDNDGNHYVGTLLFASRNRENEREEYLYFYRLDNASSCSYFFTSLKENCAGYNSLVKIENDAKFGNIVYCGTESAVNAAGIRVVDVKVNVKV